MGKKVVEVDEKTLKEIMVSDVPVFGRTLQDTAHGFDEKEGVTEANTENGSGSKKAPYNHKRKDNSQAEYRELFLVNTPGSLRVQTYINRDLYDRIKRFLKVVPSCSVASYINNILNHHFQMHWEEIKAIYENELKKPL